MDSMERPKIISFFHIMLLRLVFVGLMVAGWSSGICPKSCNCGLNSGGSREVSCTKGGLTGPLPVDRIDPHIQILRVSAPEGQENLLTIGPVFQQFQHLQELHILHSNLPAIGKHSFWGVPTLRVLNLSFNNITQVFENNFRGLGNLEELDLSWNRIESMVSGTFHHLPELRHLSLSHNRLTTLAPRLFLMLAKLKQLDLSFNNLQYLDPTVFKDVQELRVFWCRACGLRNMNPHIFSLLSGLRELDLGRNQFKYLAADDLLELKKLLALQLDGNHFPVILEGTFGSQSGLVSLSLAHNRLAKVTTRAFANLSSLVYLDLGYNKLKSLEPASLMPMAKSLRALNISGNCLQLSEFTYSLQVIKGVRNLSLAHLELAAADIPIGVFASLEFLTFLNLSGNEFQSFPVQALTSLGRLAEVDLSKNQFHGLDERLVARLENVPLVRLEDNPWACDLCHITPMLSRVNSTVSFGKAICHLPYNLKGRTLESLSVSELGWCGSGFGYREDSFAGVTLTHSTQLGLIAAGAAVAILVITMAAIVAGFLYNRRHAGFYANDQDKQRRRKSPESEVTYSKEMVSSVATIDEISKEHGSEGGGQARKLRTAGS